VNTNREHLDAETVAAWIDGGLDAASLAAAEAHASNCDRCQALLATVARTLPAEEARGVNNAATEHARSIWRWWMAPIAAATAAVTIWMVVPQEPMQPGRSTVPQSDVAAAPASPTAERTAPPPATAEPASPSDADQRAAARFAEQKRGSVATKEQLADAVASKPDAAGARAREEKREVAALQETVTVAPAAPPAGAAPAPAARNAAEPGAAVGAAAESRLQKQSGPLEIVSTNSQYRWRVLADTIEHSPDGGRTWIPVRLLAGDVITAGSSPAASVCWLAGDRGLVLLATDGTNFTRLPFPEQVDLASITATDARRATVTTADGRTFETTDNGRNWRNR
jgi:hypothetical protein